MGRAGFVLDREGFGGKPGFEVAPHRAPGKIAKIGDDAVGGENEEAFGAGVDEGHHGKFVRGVGIELAGACAGFVAEVERGFVTVVAIGNDEFLRGHGVLDGGDVAGIGDHPEAVDYPVFVGEFGDWRSGGGEFVEELVDGELRVGIEHEELTGVGVRVAEQFETVGFGARKGVFVTEDDAGGIVFEMADADEATAGAAETGAGDGEFLGVGVEGGRGVLLDDVLGDPGVEAGGGAGVDVVLRGVIAVDAAFFDGDEVVGIGGVILVLHGGSNFVVRLREDAVEGSDAGVVAESSEGLNQGHGVSVGVLSCQLTVCSNPLFYEGWRK